MVVNNCSESAAMAGLGVAAPCASGFADWFAVLAFATLPAYHLAIHVAAEAVKLFRKLLVKLFSRGGRSPHWMRRKSRANRAFAYQPDRCVSPLGNCTAFRAPLGRGAEIVATLSTERPRALPPPLSDVGRPGE